MVPRTPGETAGVAAPAGSQEVPAPRWGAIAAYQGWHGYAFNHSTRAAAEASARAQCDRVARKAGACELRIAFDNA